MYSFHAIDFSAQPIFNDTQETIMDTSLMQGDIFITN
jgi:hypothetical protein